MCVPVLLFLQFPETVTNCALLSQQHPRILGVDLTPMCWTCSIPDSPLVWLVLGFNATYNLLVPSSCDSCRGATLLQQGNTQTGLVMLCWQ